MTDHARSNRVSCDRAQRLLKAWLDDELGSPGLQEAVEAHVAACPRCQEMAADYRAISRALQRAAQVDAPEPVVSALRRRAEEVRRERVAITRSLKGVAAAAALVLVSAVGFLVSQGSGDALEDSLTHERVRYDDAMEIVLSDPLWRVEYR